MRTVHFISGLPRSGSTLLCNILAQNPRFSVAGTSGLIDMLLNVRAAWDHSPEFRAMPQQESEAQKRRTLAAMFHGYHNINHGQNYRAVGFDKSRSWLGHLEMAEAILGRKVKVLVPVRDIRDVLASFEVLWRKAAPLRQIPWEARNYFAFQSAPGRCQVWTAPDGPVGIAYNRLRDAFTRGLSDRLHLVHYDDCLTHCPQHAMEEIYDFLGEDFFSHNFDHIEPVTKEDDFAYGFPGLHDIRTKLEPARSRWKEVLGEAAEPYGSLNAFFEDKFLTKGVPT